MSLLLNYYWNRWMTLMNKNELHVWMVFYDLFYHNSWLISSSSRWWKIISDINRILQASLFGYYSMRLYFNSSYYWKIQSSYATFSIDTWMFILVFSNFRWWVISEWWQGRTKGSSRAFGQIAYNGYFIDFKYVIVFFEFSFRDFFLNIFRWTREFFLGKN